MTRRGKIARLPQTIREELNRRLQNGEPGVKLVDWLNNLPEVQQVLALEFNSEPISKCNLTGWKNGGYHEWLLRRDILSQAQETLADGHHAPAEVCSDHLGTLLTAHFACALSGLHGKITPAYKQQLESLRHISRAVGSLRHYDHNVQRLKLEQEWQELFREKSKEEVIAKFKEWLENSAVKKWAEKKDWPTPADKEKRLAEMFGLEKPVPPPDSSTPPPPAGTSLG